MDVSIRAILLSGTGALLAVGVAAGLGAGVAVGLGGVVCGRVWAITERAINVSADKIKNSLFITSPESYLRIPFTAYTDSLAKEKAREVILESAEGAK
jgi:hypothetical protein